MAISLVQHTANTQGSGNYTSLSQAFASNNTAGNLLLLCITGNSNTTPAATTPVTDTAGNTWHLASPVQSDTGAAIWNAVYYAYNCAGGANTVTITFSASTSSPDLRIFEFSGIQSASDPLDQQAGAKGLAIESSGSVTTTVANELIFGSCGTTGSAGAGTGFTGYVTSPNTDCDEYEVVSATGSYAATFTGGSGTVQCITLATFKAPTAATDPFPLVYPVTAQHLASAIYRM